ncbi:MAG: hypothetical protein LC104_22365 [Bacteroidales bacterium]|nr:hypothetical protein [Bacteroidales bacterium]
MIPISTQARKDAPATKTTDTREAEALLRDLAFVLKMTRSISAEIRGTGKPVNRIAHLNTAECELAASN